MDISEYGIMEKFVCPNTIIEKAQKVLDYGRQALRGCIRAANSTRLSAAGGGEKITPTSRFNFHCNVRDTILNM